MHMLIVSTLLAASLYPSPGKETVLHVFLPKLCRTASVKQPLLRPSYPPLSESKEMRVYIWSPHKNSVLESAGQLIERTAENYSRGCRKVLVNYNTTTFEECAGFDGEGSPQDPKGASTWGCKMNGYGVCGQKGRDAVIHEADNSWVLSYCVVVKVHMYGQESFIFESLGLILPTGVKESGIITAQHHLYLAHRKAWSSASRRAVAAGMVSSSPKLRNCRPWADTACSAQ
eukprot:392807-Pelagomonas_calceolata.AAC.1